MKRLVVHVGAQRTGSDSIHRGLFANVDVLARAGVLVPVTGRHEPSPHAVRHHLFPWSLDPAGEHPFDSTVWDTLAEELEQSPLPTALLSSELFAPVVGDPLVGPRLLERLRALSDDVTLAFVARDQLGLLNSLYCQHVKTFELTCDFDTYADQSPDLGLYDLAASFGPWYDRGPVRFVALPWDPAGEDDALAGLLAACEIPVDPHDLVDAGESTGDELGTVGIEALRLLSTYLRGSFPDFRPGEPAARRLRRRAANASLAKGWNADEFWGWSARRAEQVVDRYAKSNQEFARRTWGGDWTLPTQADRSRSVAELVELGPGLVNRIHNFVQDMASSFEKLRATPEPV